MKLNKIVGFAAIVTLAVITNNAEAIPATNFKHLGDSTNVRDNYLIQDRDGILQLPHLNIANSITFENNKKSSCKIRELSTTDKWINLIGSLIIFFSFTSCDTKNNSAVIERYVKFIFKDVLPIFIIVYLLLTLLGIANVIASTSLSSSTLVNTSSNSRNTCILK
ncbi:hypothetical protein NIES267_06350 [Calothrix parasitica NIES-267]|uniref:Uncharacterized protein n=1 Tax=Calothrix parasitica NIES-267 TaxID=1973488 RepID=A0A1Z4LIU4_9CYAN|nr:hypothetical protein NIES267_06350 [Calothrix parasitica NIES-267]